MLSSSAFSAAPTGPADGVAIDGRHRRSRSNSSGASNLSNVSGACDALEALGVEDSPPDVTRMPPPAPLDLPRGRHPSSPYLRAFCRLFLAPAEAAAARHLREMCLNGGSAPGGSSNGVFSSRGSSNRGPPDWGPSNGGSASRRSSNEGSMSRRSSNGGSADWRSLNGVASEGSLPACFRHMTWSVLLGLLPPRATEWEGLVRSRRHRYAELKSGLSWDGASPGSPPSSSRGSPDRPADEDASSAAVALDHPLSQAPDSGWRRFFSDGELRKQIDADVSRTSPDLLRRCRTNKNDDDGGDEREDRDARAAETKNNNGDRDARASLRSALFVYARRRRPDLGYRQGMHELLAVVLAVHTECCLAYREDTAAYTADCPAGDWMGEEEEGLRRLLSVFNDPRFAEHDAFWTFDRIMEGMWDWYYVPSPSPRPAATSSSAPPARGESLLGGRTLFGDEEEGADGGCHQLSPAARRLDKIWHEDLQRLDPALYRHLESSGVVPATFGVNWTKLLFQRQFGRDFLLLWDAAVATEFALVDSVVLAMILCIRRQLLSGDAIRCNTLLVSAYPAGDGGSGGVDARRVLQTALRLASPRRRRDGGGTVAAALRKGVKKGLAATALPLLSGLRRDLAASKTEAAKVEEEEGARRMVELAGRGASSSTTKEEEPFVFVGGQTPPAASATSAPVSDWLGRLNASRRSLARAGAVASAALTALDDLAASMEGFIVDNVEVEAADEAAAMADL